MNPLIFSSKSSRRKFLWTAGAIAASSILLKACQQQSPDPMAQVSQFAQVSRSQETDRAGLETPQIRLSYFPVIESAPLIVAQEKGFFAKYGMTDVKLIQQDNWTAAQDLVILGGEEGGIDGGQWQMPLPYLLSGGYTPDGKRLPMYVLAQLNTQGSGIAIANLHQDKNIKLDLTSAAETIKSFPLNQGRKFKAATPFPQVGQDFWLRYWLAAAGIDPDNDIELLALSPAEIAQGMIDNTLDGCCTAEPWPSRLVADETAYIAALSSQVWKFHPGDYLAIRADWVDRNIKATKAILKGVMEAQQWCDEPDNREELARILSRHSYFNLPTKVLMHPYEGRYKLGDDKFAVNNFKLGPLYWKDSMGNVSYPYKSHDLWFLVESIRWGFLPKQTLAAAPRAIDSVNRHDLWKEAARELDLPDSEIPKSASRGYERFFDGITFDPEAPEDYLKTLEIKRI